MIKKVEDKSVFQEATQTMSKAAKRHNIANRTFETTK